MYDCLTGWWTETTAADDRGRCQGSARSTSAVAHLTSRGQCASTALAAAAAAATSPTVHAAATAATTTVIAVTTGRL